MKFFALVSVFLASSSAFSMVAPTVTCHTRGIADAGYGITVALDEMSETGALVAELSSMRIYGPVALGKGLVKQTRRGDRVTFSNKDLRLTVDLSRPIYPEGLVFEGSLKGAGLAREFSKMSCRVSSELVRPAPVEPYSITCMAYFTGFTYDAKLGKCVKLGASGCSNPFEFAEQASCDLAYSIN